ncbi:hypothetical protein GCM10023193_01360 [Planotetraspora kaengkrachanensis]|uniref:Uncharacterized protein n=2 Tax=Planotetraspora kaengkrachanensis TaxID=575193 RepID=A0A8J3PP55_9ACTN|nr:hypothetical protein Pka01_04230 [Planotetraspora kaengkrachanensis]
MALIGFLGAGLGSPPPTALMVTALADARRSVAARLQFNQPTSEWLAEETRAGGIRENAAVPAVMEMGSRRQPIADAYQLRHPDRIRELTGLLAVLKQA